jgi:hypothetical protein
VSDALNPDSKPVSRMTQYTDSATKPVARNLPEGRQGTPLPLELETNAMVVMPANVSAGKEFEAGI